MYKDKKIRTAEEMLNYFGIESKPERILALQEYAKQFIDLAADSAEAKLDYDFHDAFVNKESILKLKELIK